MKRSVQRSRHDLGDSWVVEENDHDGGVSANSEDKDNTNQKIEAQGSDYTEGSEDEDSPDQQTERRLRRSPRKHITKRSPDEVDSSEEATRVSTRLRRSTRQNRHIIPIEPELVYPSLQQESPSTSFVPAEARESLFSSAAPISRRNYTRASIRNSTRAAEAVQTVKPDRSAFERTRRHRPSGTNNIHVSKRGHMFDTVWNSMVSPVFGFGFSILGRALHALKAPLSYALAIWMLFGSMIMIQNLVTSSISNALSPICRIPGISYLNVPFCRASQPAAPVEFDQLMTVQSAFEDVLTSAAGGATLPLDMKRSEASIRDLKHVVKFSNLPSRNELVFEFTGFIETARQASGDLTRFNSRIGRAVDHILNTNHWTLQVLDGVYEEDASRGSVSAFFADKVLAPFQPVRLTEHIVLEQYLRHTRAIEEQIADLIVEAQALLGILQNLDDRLDVIADIAARDGVTAQGNRDELWATLWTKLGGNRSSVNKLNEQLQLLKHVGHYRKMAWAHVSGTILKLQSIAAGLEDLRERVAAPEVVGVRDEIPLKLHIENIKLGVERLEAQRFETRRLEGENYQRILDKSNGFGKDRMIDGGKTVTVVAA